jgi:hypothetical protein
MVAVIVIIINNPPPSPIEGGRHMVVAICGRRRSRGCHVWYNGGHTMRKLTTNKH